VTLPRKPPQSSESPTILKIRIDRGLKRAEKESAEKRQFAVLEKVLEWAGTLNRVLGRTGTEGNVFWWPIVAAALGCLAIVIWAWNRSSQDHVLVDQKNGVYQILNRYDSHHYRFNEISSGQPLRVHFCEKKGDADAAAQLSAGFTLWQISYRDSHDKSGVACWDIEVDGYGYRLMANRDGTPTLAPNCHAGEKIYECVPNLTEAIFTKEK